MSTLWAASVRHLLRHRAQLALALLGLTLGVATITAVDLAAASSTRAFELSSQATSGGATHELSGRPGGIDEQLFVRLSAPHPELALAPLVTGYVGVRGESLQLIGMDPLAAADFGAAASGGTTSLGPSIMGPSRDAPQTTLARWLLTPGAAVLAAPTARRLGLHSGDAFEVEVSGRRYPAALIATTSAAGADALLVLAISRRPRSGWASLDGCRRSSSRRPRASGCSRSSASCRRMCISSRRPPAHARGSR